MGGVFQPRTAKRSDAGAPMISLAPKLETWARTSRGNSIARRLAGVVRANSHPRSRVSLAPTRTAKHNFPAQSSRDEVLHFVTRAKRAGLAALALARILGVAVLLPRDSAAILPAS